MGNLDDFKLGWDKNVIKFKPCSEEVEQRYKYLK